ncbi:uncharacterized protein LTR77_008279 [Saxophila tyrrhenica]|uniref:Enoyl reductase (ER) domain-containing protein n=1 Tax=Saxophila tyrrhenica TaxID=1690608 RepID=A0AAV9P4C6_9PEZI|nr:hypothetical protein LTR77_008279 [Saxophila tyrrhenica]
MTQNKSLIFKKIPTGTPVAGEHLVVEDRPIDLDAPLPDNGILVHNLYFSFDPYQRGRMRDVSIPSYSPAYPLDQPIKNSSIARVLRSNNPRFSKDDLITNYMSGNFEEYSLIPESELSAEVVWKLDNPYDLPPQDFLGPLGMPGLTAYSSFYEIGQPKRGETIFISAASGAVGSLVGQLAKREGLRVIGSVGDDAKLEYILKDLGFDAGFNYKRESPMDGLKRLAPDGIDVYYESVGGAHLEAALSSLKLNGRIVVSGMISDYNKPFEQKYGVRNLQVFFEKRLKMQGFIVADLSPKYFEEHQKNVQKWMKEGSLKAKMAVTVGMDQAAEGLLGLFEGSNFGKAILQVGK